MFPQSDESGMAVRAEIWGTTVNVEQAKQAFTKFYHEFLDTSGPSNRHAATPLRSALHSSPRDIARASPAA